MSHSDLGLTIPDEELTAPLYPEPALLSLPQRVMMLDELLPNLALDPSLFSHDEELEYQAKRSLLQLYCTILAMTKNDSWQVKVQWLYPGATIQVGGQDISLPCSISGIIDIITTELAKKHKANYKEALDAVQTIAAEYESDWYTWIRNKLPIIGAAPSVKELFSKVLKIRMEAVAAIEPRTASISSVSAAITSGLSFLSALIKDPEKEEGKEPPSLTQ